MKSCRAIKLRRLCPTPLDLALASPRNPLKREVVVHPAWNTTEKFMKQYTIPVDFETAVDHA